MEEFEHPWHYHPEIELTYILSGQGTRYVGNSIENYMEDDLVLLGANLPHCWLNDPNERASSSLALYLNQEFIDDTWMQSNEFASIRNLLTLADRGISFGGKVALELKKRCLALPALSSIDRVVELLQILKVLAHTPEYHVLCGAGYSYELNHNNNERINAVYKYIEKNYHRKIPLAAIAAEVSMSEEYFSRFFSKIMRKTFIEFLTEYRINKACRLLIETDKQISEIGYSVGFESIPFFYRQFKKFKNNSPKIFRSSYYKAQY